MKILLCISLVSLFAIAPLWAKNMALELDGTSAIQVPNSDSLNPRTAITIEAWMNMSKPVGECLAKDWEPLRDYIFPEIVQNGNGLRFVLWPGPKILDVPGLQPNKWQHLAGVWDGKEMRTYIDGVKKGASPFAAKELTATDASLYIGVGANKNWFCKGFIDEVRIWAVARTEKEINEFRMSVLNGDEKGLNAHYTFDESNAKDNTKNGNDGKVGFGKPIYADVTKDLNLQPLAVDPKAKLTTTWAQIKQTQ